MVTRPAFFGGTRLSWSLQARASLSEMGHQRAGFKDQAHLGRMENLIALRRVYLLVMVKSHMPSMAQMRFVLSMPALESLLPFEQVNA
jgi:hypothetical protein